VQSPGQAEIQNLDQPAVGEHDILRLEVAMEDAERVRRLETVCDLNTDREHQLDACRTARDQQIQRLAGDELHHDISFFACFADFVDGADIRMLDGRGQPCLAQYRRAHLTWGQQAAAQNLEHHRARQQGVVC